MQDIGYYFRQALDKGLKALSNDNISDHMDELSWGPDHGGLNYDQELHVQNVAEAVQKVLNELYIDTANDHNTKDTAVRVARMYVTELMAGRYEPEPRVTTFPNITEVDELYTVGPIAIRSLCSHHMMPVTGRAWIGVIPSADKLIGLSKFSRLARWIFARPQIQEEATQQLADLLEKYLDPLGLAVVVKASHMCMTLRGVCDSDAVMTTSVMRGALRERPEARAEFLAFIDR